MGRSRGGFSTKLHALVDTQGRPRFVSLTQGNRHETTVAKELIAVARGKAFIADAGYDSDAIRIAVASKGMLPVICPQPQRKRPIALNKELYRKRYLVEVFFHQLKRFRAVATRFEKTSRNYLALVQLACSWLWLN